MGTGWGRVTKYTPEQTIPQACKKIGISDQTFYRWRTKYGALKEDEAHRLKALETENARLKRIVA
jgi:transposase-like protein